MNNRSPRPRREDSGAEQELNGRDLLRRYGRDPRRPSWADAHRGEDRTAASGDDTAWSGRRSRRHQSVCAACGQVAMTNFRPDPARPVYCDGCYRVTRGTRRPAAVISASSSGTTG
jgi:CxxC-x17-CxxC domain-containing protein